MNETAYAFLILFALFAMIFLTRALPFFFSAVLKNNATLRTVGNYLPPYIMMLLVIYEVGVGTFKNYPYGIPAVIALSALVIVHLWKRQLLLSLFLGTTLYVFSRYLMGQ